ncbi:lysophospholipid acyltransferase family protein [Cardiobacteriaceae bacterium TAE3-ERU3]|nr:lysophospholipid acyltransferase family protein [Cardiobacteriaceae bacterium TAE3-ERU3]
MTKKNQQEQDATFDWQLIHPRFWGHWLLLGLLRFVVLLPYSLRMGIGSLLGKLMFAVMRYRREISIVNIDKAFPELSTSEREQLLDEFSKNLGRGVIEMGMAWFSRDNELLRRCDFEGDEHSLALLQDDDTPVILVGMHTTMLELGLRLLGLYVDAGGLYKPIHDPLIDRWLRQLRGSIATELVQAQNMRHILRFLRDGNNLWYAFDQDMGPRVSVFAPFFGIEAATVNVLPKLRERTDAHWVPVFMWREDDWRYSVRVLPEIEAIEGETDEALMTRVNAIFEQEIRAHPAQYYWVHRRFKSTPTGRIEDYPDKSEM